MRALAALLPDRGSLGLAQLTGYTYLRTWRTDLKVKDSLAAFPTLAALELVNRHKLLDGWTPTARIESGRRDSVQEIGKELLHP